MNYFRKLLIGLCILIFLIVLSLIVYKFLDKDDSSDVNEKQEDVKSVLSVQEIYEKEDMLHENMELIIEGDLSQASEYRLEELYFRELEDGKKYYIRLKDFTKNYKLADIIKYYEDNGLLLGGVVQAQVQGIVYFERGPICDNAGCEQEARISISSFDQIKITDKKGCLLDSIKRSAKDPLYSKTDFSCFDYLKSEVKSLEAYYKVLESKKCFIQKGFPGLFKFENGVWSFAVGYYGDYKYCSYDGVEVLCDQTCRKTQVE